MAYALQIDKYILNNGEAPLINNKEKIYSIFK